MHQVQHLAHHMSQYGLIFGASNTLAVESHPSRQLHPGPVEYMYSKLIFNEGDPKCMYWLL